MSDLPNKNKKIPTKKSRDDTADLKNVSPVSKERSGGLGKQEVTPVTEYTKKVDLEPEVEGWLEKLEKEDTSLSKPMVDPTDKKKKVLENAEDEKGKFQVILPLTKEEVDKGLHHKVVDSVRWLAEWCVKMIKMFSGKVAYRRK